MTVQRRSHEKLAKLHDREYLPLWSERFGRLFLHQLTLPPKAMVLDVGCGSGYPSLEILRRMDEQSRIIAIDASAPLLDEARTKAGTLSGKRIFFRTEAQLPRLSFADDVYDLVVSNALLHEFEQPRAALTDFIRVCKPGGTVVVTTPLEGTFAEFHDLYREVLVKLDQGEAIDKLDQYLERYPTIDKLEQWAAAAGLVDIRIEQDTFTLLFKSGREFFYAPVIEYGPLSDWKALVGKGKVMQDVFWELKSAIDAYFGWSSFAVTVVAGCVIGRKSETPIVVRDTAPARPEPEASSEVSVSVTSPGDDLAIELGTSEIDLIELEREHEGRIDGDDDDPLG